MGRADDGMGGQARDFIKCWISTLLKLLQLFNPLRAVKVKSKSNVEKAEIKISQNWFLAFEASNYGPSLSFVGKNQAIGPTYQFHQCWWLILNALSVEPVQTYKEGPTSKLVKIIWADSLPSTCFYVELAPFLLPKDFINMVLNSAHLREFSTGTDGLDGQVRRVVGQSDETVSSRSKSLIAYFARFQPSRRPSLLSFSFGSRYGNYQRRKKWTWKDGVNELGIQTASQLC